MAALVRSIARPVARSIARGQDAGGGWDFTDDLSDGAGTPMAITTTIAANQAWQRGRSTLTLAGTYDLSGDPTGIAWRVGSGDWVQLTAETIGSGNWSGTLAIPSGYLAQGTLEVKPVNGLNVTPATQANLTISDIWVVNGQSNADGYATNLQTYAGANFTWLVAFNGGLFSPKTVDPTWNSNGSIWPAFAEALDAAGIPPAFVSGATIDGTGYANGNWNPGDTIYDQAVTRLNNALSLSGGCAGEIWWQGEADSSSNMAEQDYIDASIARRNGFDANIANFSSSTPTYLFQLGEHGGAGIENIRAALKRLRGGEDARFRHGPNLLGEQWGDGTHAGIVQGNVDAAEAEAQLDRIAAQLFRAVTSGATCPAITSAAADQTNFDQVTITFDKAMENHDNPAGWVVTDDGGSVEIVSTAQGATTSEVVITCIRDLYGAVTVSWGVGNDEFLQIEGINTLLREATAVDGVKLPPEYHASVAAGTGAGEAPSGILTNGDFASGLAGWTQTGTTWEATAGAANVDVSRGGGGALFLRQSISGLVAGETYSYALTITARVAGSVSMRVVGATTVTSANYALPGTYSETFVCPAAPTEFALVGNASANLTVDDVLIELVP